MKKSEKKLFLGQENAKSELGVPVFECLKNCLKLFKNCLSCTGYPGPRAKYPKNSH